MTNPPVSGSVPTETPKRCLAQTYSGLPQAPYLYCTLPEGHEDAHEATNLRTGETEKAWSKAPWELP